MKYKYLLLVVLFFGVLNTVPTKAQVGGGCGYYVGNVYIFCTNETRLIFCDAGRAWALERYDIQVGATTYRVSRWTCGGSTAVPGSPVVPPRWVDDFPIAHYQYGESFDAYCIGGEQYIQPFPAQYSGEETPANVPLDQFLCLDYFPYDP